MKNKKLLLSLLALTVLTSCGNTIGGLKKGDDILNGTIIENNFEEVEEKEEINTLVQSKLGEVSFDSEEILRYYSCGVIATINKEGYVGFYSLLHQKQIIANQFEERWVKYNVIEDGHVGFFISIDYEGKRVVYDSIGNQVLSCDEREEYTYQTEVFNDVVYLTVTHTLESDLNPENTFYKYVENGTLQQIESISDDVLENVVEDEEENEFPFGSQYNEMQPLEEYGLEGFVSTADNILTLYNANKEVINTYILPSNTMGYAVITNKLYYQVITSLPEDAKKYDLYYSAENNFYSKGQKYKISTYSINLENGKEKEEDLDFVIIDAEPYKGATDGEKYSIITMQLITKEKAFGDTVAYLIDSKGVLHDQVNGVYVRDFIKVGENYLNEETGILYDSQLNEIAYLSNIDPKYNEKANYIIGRLDGKYGILDTSAKVVLEFSAEEIVSEIVDNKVITRRGDVYYRNDLISGQEEVLGINFQSLGNGAYVTFDEYNYYFHNAASLLHTVSLENLDGFSYNHVQATLNNASYYVLIAQYKSTVTVFDEESNEYVEEDVYTNKYITLDINRLPSDSSLTTIGTEKTSEINYADEASNALELNLGEGFIHGYKQNIEYYEFTPEVSGYYTFTTDSLIDLYVTGKNGSVNKTENENSELGITETTVALNAGDTYTFYASHYYYPAEYTAYPYNFELELGDDNNFPLIYAANNNEVLTNLLGEAHILFQPEYDAKYTVQIEDGSIYLNGNYYYNGDEIYLQKGQSLSIRYASSNSEVAKKKIDFIVDPANQDPSMSLFTATEISIDSENPTAINHSNAYGNYYKYVNKSTKEQVVVLSADSTSYYSSNYVLYNNELEQIESGYFDYDSKLYAVVKPNEAVYLELETGDTATALLANFTLVSSETIEENTQYDINETKAFKLPVSSYTGLATLSYSSSLSTNVILFNSDGEVVDSFNGSSGITDVIFLDGEENYYAFITGSEGNVVSFNINEVSVSSLYLFNEDDYLATNTLNSGYEQWYQYTNTSTETEIVKFTIENDGTVSNAYLSIYDDGQSGGRHNLYYYEEYFDTYEVKPGESIYILIENENYYSYTFYYTIKAEISQ